MFATTRVTGGGAVKACPFTVSLYGPIATEQPRMSGEFFRRNFEVVFATISIALAAGSIAEAGECNSQSARQDREYKSLSAARNAHRELRARRPAPTTATSAIDWFGFETNRPAGQPAGFVFAASNLSDVSISSLRLSCKASCRHSDGPSYENSVVAHQAGKSIAKPPAALGAIHQATVLAPAHLRAPRDLHHIGPPDVAAWSFSRWGWPITEGTTQTPISDYSFDGGRRWLI